MLMETSKPVQIRRRDFLGKSAAVAVSLSLSPSVLQSAAETQEKIKIGLIGCGGRGGWIANLFQKHGGYNFVAAADYFPDRVQAVGDRLQVPAERRFTGLSA